MSSAGDDLRVRVAAQLEAWAAPGGPLALTGDRTTVAVADYYHRGNPTEVRRQFRNDVEQRFLALNRSVRQEGKAALLTAGPPGAGKSSALDRLGLAGEGWRRLDADVVKEFLVADAAGVGPL